MTAPKKAKSNVEYTAETVEDTTIIVRSENDQPLNVGQVKNGVLSYPDRETRKLYHPQVTRFLNDSQIPFDPNAVTVLGEAEAEKSPKKVDYKKAPKQTIEQGDKTPAFVDWVRENDPEQYKVRYGIRGPGKVEKVTTVIDHVTQRPRKELITINAILSDRKIHTTERIDAASTIEAPDDDES